MAGMSPALAASERIASVFVFSAYLEAVHPALVLWMDHRQKIDLLIFLTPGVSMIKQA
jgi:hypothetical protein